MPPSRPLLGLREPVTPTRAFVSGVAIWALFFGVWYAATAAGIVNELLVPSPQQVLGTLWRLVVHDGFAGDILTSIGRVLASFAAACAVALPLGVLMGSFPALRALIDPFVSAWRYLPAPSFIPILLMWFGTGEAPKLALLFIGVVFFLITLITDHTRAVRDELVETALTLGADRRTTVRTVILPAVMPDVLVAMRQMMAITWT